MFRKGNGIHLCGSPMTLYGVSVSSGREGWWGWGYLQLCLSTHQQWAWCVLLPTEKPGRRLLHTVQGSCALQEEVDTPADSRRDGCNWQGHRVILVTGKSQSCPFTPIFSFIEWAKRYYRLGFPELRVITLILVLSLSFSERGITDTMYSKMHAPLEDTGE